MEDKNGNLLHIGMDVIVPEPNSTDIHNHDFVGRLTDFRNGNAVIADGEGDCFEIEPERLKIYVEEKLSPEDIHFAQMSVKHKQN